MNLKAILFDMDGTLTDSERYYTDGTYEWMKRFGYDDKIESLYPIIGTSMDVTYDILYDLLKGKLTRDEIIYQNEHYFNVENPINYQEYIFDEVYEVLHKLKEKGLKFAICSSSYKKDIEEFLKCCKLDMLFDVVISSHECKNPKPSGEIYLKALKRLGLTNQEAIVVEDSAIGIRAGKNADIFVVARKEERFDIDQSEADVLVSDLNDLYKLVGELNDE